MASLPSKEAARARLIQLPKLALDDAGGQEPVDEQTAEPTSYSFRVRVECSTVIADIRRAVRKLSHRDSYLLHGDNAIGLQQPFARAWERKLRQLLKFKPRGTSLELETTA